MRNRVDFITYKTHICWRMLNDYWDAISLTSNFDAFCIMNQTYYWRDDITVYPTLDSLKKELD